MDKGLKVIAIAYFGRELSKPEVVELVKAISHVQGVVEADVFQISGKDLITDIVSRLHREENPEREYTAEDNAVIYIGTKLKEVLSHRPWSPSKLMDKVLKEIELCGENPNLEENRSFMNSLFILSQEDLKISKELLKKYNLDSEKINIIKNVYRMVSR